MTTESLVGANMTSLFNDHWRPKGHLRTTGRESGASLIEFALFLPLLMATLFGMLNLGRFAYLTIEISSAAHAGAQYGSLHQANANNNTQIEQAACNDVPDIPACSSTCSGSATSNCLTVPTPTLACYCSNAPGTAISCSSSCSAPAVQIDNLTVTATGTFNSWIPFPPFTNTLTITRQASMAVGQY
jgi:Flp pilus assembly protein TadG